MSDKSFDYANLSNLAFIEKLYQDFLKDPSSIEPSWRYFFQGMEMAGSLQKFPYQAPAVAALSCATMIERYRHFGHLQAKINPLSEPELSDLLSLQACGFQADQLHQMVETCGLLPEPKAPLSECVKVLQSIYCNTVGVEAQHVDPKIQAFIYQAIEKFKPSFDQKRILDMLNRSESFEAFIQLKYPGQKRFSLEGAETLIPVLDAFFEKCCALEVEDCLIAMAHRGRLNVLTNIMRKSYAEVFEEFSPGFLPASEGSDDVKYHKGYSSTFQDTKGQLLKIELCPNPSHLESVDPVVEGLTKALQIQKGSTLKAVAVMIHGDAALAGQGIVYEVMQMSDIDGYGTGGTIHLVINNQIGFTATAQEGRSTRYCTDIAKAFGAPVFHVNAEDPEACVMVAQLALEMRQKFGVDVFIDIIGYRKYGHSEGDEPSFTQPQMYEKIRQKKNIRDLYKQKLVDLKVLSDDQIQVLQQEFALLLEAAQLEVSSIAPNPGVKKTSSPTQLEIPTAVSYEKLHQLAQTFCSIPSSTQPHPKVAKLFQQWLSFVSNKQTIDWGLAEYLAYASILVDNKPVRISGQDCKRGTFAHRHAALVDQVTNQPYYPLAHLQAEQGLFSVYNSLLSEFGVLGFEFGYAQKTPGGLTIWEAQFGDFANSAQIIIDQYISSSEQKWNVKNPIVLMLPHGYEGGGPEHSSARLERFLQLCAQENMKIVVPSCSAQVFHLLRQQALESNPCPLVLFNPKSMLRFAPSLSPLAEFTQGQFRQIIPDQEHLDAQRVIFCCGKVYYDLVAKRESLKDHSTALIRIEQLYPLNPDLLKQTLQQYSKYTQCYFVQEEPENMGAYSYLAPRITEILPEKIKLCYVGRARSASPAAGSFALHQKEKEKFLKEAFD